VLDKFVPLLKRYIKEFWADGSNIEDMGRIINDFHLDRCCDLVRDHKSQIIIGNANAHEDKKITPTVVLNPEKDTPLMKDEIFGPILPLVTFKAFDEAINYINELDKPLVSYYFGH